MDKFVEKLISIQPSEHQIAWQTLGFTAFLHYGMNTFTNTEWGNGKENPASYNPANLDTDQWCYTLKTAGITACIITAKHHDGFCLFDTAHTEHGVMHSPKPIDVVASLADSCVKHGLKMGVYLSPWDMNAPTYGSGMAYDDFFCAQLDELTTKYGPLYTVWFDGACGEGANGKKQVYDWNRYFSVIRRNQPQAAIAICGPDVRWIGNEGGNTRTSEWSVVHERMRDSEKTAALSQQSDDTAFREQRIRSEDEDLGSRERLAAELAAGGDLCWYPAEVDVSIRPGWFYHPEEDDKIRSLENLLDIYEKSVGGNAVLLLNIPPDTSGQIHAADALRLKELGERLSAIYDDNIFAKANVFIDGTDRIHISLDTPKVLTHIVLCEEIRKSQRIEYFEVYAEIDDDWKKIFESTTIGFKKICCFCPVEAKNWRINIIKSRSTPTIRFIGGYRDTEADLKPL